MISYLISRSITSNTLFDVLEVHTQMHEDGVEYTEEIKVQASSVPFEVAAEIVEELKKVEGV